MHLLFALLVASSPLTSAFARLPDNALDMNAPARAAFIRDRSGAVVTIDDKNGWLAVIDASGPLGAVEAALFATARGDALLGVMWWGQDRGAGHLRFYEVSASPAALIDVTARTLPKVVVADFDAGKSSATHAAQRAASATATAPVEGAQLRYRLPRWGSTLDVTLSQADTEVVALRYRFDKEARVFVRGAAKGGPASAKGKAMCPSDGGPHPHEVRVPLAHVALDDGRALIACEQSSDVPEQPRVFLVDEGAVRSLMATSTSWEQWTAKPAPQAIDLTRDVGVGVTITYRVSLAGVRRSCAKAAHPKLPKEVSAILAGGPLNVAEARNERSPTREREVTQAIESDRHFAFLAALRGEPRAFALTDAYDSTRRAMDHSDEANERNKNTLTQLRELGCL